MKNLKWCLLLAAWLAANSLGCPDDTPILVYEVDGLDARDTLSVRLKRYNDDGTVSLFDAEPIAVRAGTERLSLQIPLPSTGRWAAHLVATGAAGRPAAETRCHVVDGMVTDSNVHLSVLSPAVDADGDTFPDDYRLYCAERTAAGLPCANECEAPEFLALLDCNPPEDLEVEPGCVEVPPAAAQWHPFATDICADCYDQDCYGGDPPCEDADEDGYRSDVDCDDTNPAVNPGVEEGCRLDDTTQCPGCGDMTDNNCDGRVDEGCFGDDFDQDGVPVSDDCNDCDPGIGPGFAEICGNGVDEDCSAPTDPAEGDLPCDEDDLDGDGYAFVADGDCDDTDPRIYPGAPDYCGDDAIQNCVSDRECDDDDDHDGFIRGDDCDDANAEVNPWAAEVCDPEGVDDDCDGVINEVNDPGHRMGCGRNAGTGLWTPVDFRTDPEHCGGCRQRCAGSTWSIGDRCAAGACSCGGGEACAGTSDQWCCPASGCVDLATDLQNCGACNSRCQPGEECRPADDGAPGACHCPFEEDDRACPGGACWRCCPDQGCVNVCTDLQNCGSCGNDCTGGERPMGDACVEGECLCGDDVEPCAGTTFCTWVAAPEAGCGCQDLFGDPMHCGECDLECGEGELCNDGICGCGGDEGCPDGTICCATGCADLQTDANNCSACGNACDPGEDCVAGTCLCGEECEDGDPCTMGTCTGSNCTQEATDADGDGYCDADCPPVEGIPRRCTDGDCDDSDADIYPGQNELCNGVDDDCSATTTDGLQECTATHESCQTSDPIGCVCDAGWSDCASTCDCNTDGEQICCGGSCRPGDCCNNGDCTDPINPECVTNNCTCRGLRCTELGECRPAGSECCDDDDCPGSRQPHCDPDDFQCSCLGIVCSTVCRPGGECCNDADCGPAAVCCGNTCVPGDCCDDADCGDPSRWDCVDNSCDCAAGHTSCSGECCETGTGMEECCPTAPFCRAPGGC